MKYKRFLQSVRLLFHVLSDTFACRHRYNTPVARKLIVYHTVFSAASISLYEFC